MSVLWKLLVGHPLPTVRLASERLNKARALAALSPDALSSIAYANQEIFLGLAVAGAAGLHYSLPIAVAITALLAILTLSYSQTILAYPGGGGSYTVARENLGKWLGLVAAAALLIDYVLTAAVSLTAGVAAIASALPFLWPHRTTLALLLLFLITTANLRGLRDSSTLVSIPVYLFLFAYLSMIAIGIVKAVVEGPGVPAATTLPALQPLTLFLVLHTFSTGCTALTGVEAISNGVAIFKKPETINARRTLIVMAVLMGILLLGTIGLTQALGVVAGAEETILSALIRRIFGDGIVHVLISVSTLLILVVATNTSYVDFPRVAHILADDGVLPHQLNQLGDRLVYSNGILLLSALVAVLIIAFEGDSHALIPLFAVGVFLAFTLSQTGMVIHWLKERGRQWQVKAFFNGLGAVTTAVTLVVVAISKFLEGAWVVVLLILLVVLMFRAIERHYQGIRPQLSLSGLTPTTLLSESPRVVLSIAGVHRGVLAALAFARSMSNRVTAVYIEIDPAATPHIREMWEKWGQDVPLVVVESPYRSIVGTLLNYLEEADKAANDGERAVLVLPEFIPAHWWENALHNQTAWILKLALLYQRQLGSGRVVVDVPFHLRA